MPAPVEFTVRVASLPPGFKGDPQALLTAFGERMIITPSEPWSSFVNGGAQPSSNVGPFLFNGVEWRVWSDGLGTYTFQTLDGAGLIAASVSRDAMQDGTPNTALVYGPDGRPKMVSGLPTQVLTAGADLSLSFAPPASGVFFSMQLSADFAYASDGANHQIPFDLIYVANGVVPDIVNFRIPIPKGSVWVFGASLQIENTNGATSTGVTAQDATSTDATEEAAPAAEGGSLSDVPPPAAVVGVSPLSPPPSLTDVAPPVAAAAPNSSGIVLPAGIAVSANVPLKDAMEAERIKVARANKIAPQFVTDKQLADSIGITTTKEIFVDPKTQNSYEVQVTKDRTGAVYKASDPILHERSKTQQTIDTEAAKDYQEYTQNHGADRDKADIATLDGAIKILRDPNTKGASGPIVNLLPEGLRAFVTSEDSLKAPQMIKSVVQNHLKEIFGARVTNFDYQKSLELIFNPALSEETNAERAGNLRNTLASALENKRESMQYFAKHGTLEGFDAKSLKPVESGPSTSTSSSTSKLGDTKYIGDRAYVLKKNEVTGKREWVAQ